VRPLLKGAHHRLTHIVHDHQRRQQPATKEQGLAGDEHDRQHARPRSDIGGERKERRLEGTLSAVVLAQAHHGRAGKKDHKEIPTAGDISQKVHQAHRGQQAAYATHHQRGHPGGADASQA